MTQSSEYPDLRWMPPKSWTDANRSGVQLVVIHTTEGAARASAAEDGASYDQRRTDGTSTHYFHDSDSTVQCVRTNDQAHTARTQGNRRGIHHELCTRAGSANWADAYHQAMLRHAAKQAARDAQKWGIPARHLTVAQVAAGEKGFCGHYDITRAFPQDNGTHTDPGQNFPWSQFLDLVRAELTPQKLEDDMPTPADYAKAVWEYSLINPNTNKGQPASDYQRYTPSSYPHSVTQAAIAQLSTTLNAFIASEATDDATKTQALQAIRDAVEASAPAIVTQVLAALPPGVEVSADQLQAALVGALRELAAAS